MALASASASVPAVAFGNWGFCRHAPGTTYGPRRYADHDFMLVSEGSARWEVDGASIEVPRGGLILARPGMRDRLTWNPRIPNRNFYLHFTLGSSHGLPRGLPPAARWPLMRVLPDGDVVRPLLTHIARLLERRPPSWRESASAALIAALHAFIHDTGTGAAPERPLPPAIERAITAVARRWSRGTASPMGLDELSAAARLSREQLCRLFRAQLGCGPIAALRLLRLERATLLLGRPDLSVQEVGRLCGFEDQFHFSRTFSQTFGCSPRGFRQRLSDGSPWPSQALDPIRGISRRLWEVSAT
ncbi:MAG: helix-turn-helix transcriptional regulator [Planctomycetes bacterium]|nr:helix-turn-helix transcriptional regulator [Planctomycetota bacterium]